MAKRSFIPRNVQGMVFWFNNFASKLPIYAAKYNILLTDVEAMQVAAIYYQFVVNFQVECQEYNVGYTAFRNNLASGETNFNQISEFPKPPKAEDLEADPPKTIPTAAPNGTFKIATSIALKIKSSTNFDILDGQDLGIIGETITFDPDTVKPVFTIRLVSGGHPEIVWTRGFMDGVEIAVKRPGDVEFVKLATDLKPNYIDMHPLPALGRAEVWEYRLIYIYNDQYIGTYSDVVGVTVTGF